MFGRNFNNFKIFCKELHRFSHSIAFLGLSGFQQVLSRFGIKLFSDLHKRKTKFMARKIRSRKLQTITNTKNIANNINYRRIKFSYRKRYIIGFVNVK